MDAGDTVRYTPAMAQADHDQRVRLAAFDFLARLTEQHGEYLPYRALREGFSFEGARVPLLAAQGIHKPAVLALPLTIATAPPAPGKTPPYADELSADGFLLYRYRGTDPLHRDNVGLRALMQSRRPLIYLHGVVPGEYLASWPVHIVDDHPARLTFTVSLDEAAAGPPAVTAAEPRKAYVTRLTLHRLHQAAFRQRVLRAYQTRCAMCRLRRAELLDAAHILPDTDPRSAPTVPNGLALCKLHHAAFDGDILGVRPDLVIEVRADVLAEIDGPMLRHGLQELAGLRLEAPRRRLDQPDAAFLDERYERFRRAG